MAKKKDKIRAKFRKNRVVRARENDLTRKFEEDWFEEHDSLLREQVSGKGDIARKRTVVGAAVSGDDASLSVQPDIDPATSQQGRVLRVQGLTSTVQAEDGTQYRCVTRRLLKTLETDQRHVVAAGDRVWFRALNQGEGAILGIQPRHGILNRAIQGKQQVLVANVDQVVIVASGADPYLKPHLIDRLLVTCENNELQPVICINKVDLVDPADLQPLVGVYSQMGYSVLLLSAKRGTDIHQLRQTLAGKESVVTGQSGVGKSSLLNAVDDSLALRVQDISRDTHKGRHTTTTAELLPLACGGFVVDTPGIRQYQLWDVIPEEVAGFYRDIRPYVSFCRFASCTHTHEVDCAVKDAVADGRIDTRRYESFVQLQASDPAG